MKRLLLGLVLASAVLTSLPARSAAQDDVRAAFERFVVAQNAHDLATVRDLLLPSPDFVWVTRGTVIWGADAALTRFATLYQGTWKLSPDAAGPKVVMLNESVAQLVAPVTFNIGPSGQAAPDTPFILTQVWVRTNAGWKIGSLLPIPVPPVAPPTSVSTK